MWYAVYSVWDRFWWYGVPAICEHPDCNKEIDRWMSYACWWEPFSEHWCDRYFCEKHLGSKYIKEDWSECNCEDDCKCESVDLCERCRDNKDPFPYKPEHKRWIKHILKDESWEERRNDNPKKIKEFLNVK